MVHKFTPGLNRTFEQAKESLRDSMKSENYRKLLTDIDEELDNELNVFRSDEVKKVDR